MSQVPAKKNTAYTFFVGLTSQSQGNTFQASPTLASGDVKSSQDDGANWANLATLPSVTAGDTKVVKVSLSAGEMNSDRVLVKFSDASGAEWKDKIIEIHTSTLQVDDLSTLTQTQVTGGAYALNSSSFAFNSALGFTTTQKAATLARVTLVDTTTTNSDMRGTDNAALAATALSTAVWTNTLATNLATLIGKFTGITLLAEWLGLIAGKQTGNSTARTELRATGAGSGTYDETTDSLEAVRERGDAAWTTATGFSTLDAAGVRAAVGLTSANLDTQLNTITNQTLDTAIRGAVGLGAADLDTQLNNIYGLAGNVEVDTQDIQSRLGTISDLGNGATVGHNLADLWSQTAVVEGKVDAVQADLPTRPTKNVALAGFTFVLFDSTSHATPTTGLTVTAQRSLDGASFASCTNAVSEVGSGVYKIDLAAADMNGNVVILKFSATGADTAFCTIITQPT